MIARVLLASTLLGGAQGVAACDDGDRPPGPKDGDHGVGGAAAGSAGATGGGTSAGGGGAGVAGEPGAGGGSVGGAAGSGTGAAGAAGKGGMTLPACKGLGFPCSPDSPPQDCEKGIQPGFGKPSRCVCAFDERGHEHNWTCTDL